MAQTFMRDDELCKQYAKFAADLDRWHFKIIYWFMFVLNLVILFVASWAYIRCAIFLTNHQGHVSCSPIQKPRYKRTVQS